MGEFNPYQQRGFFFAFDSGKRIERGISLTRNVLWFRSAKNRDCNEDCDFGADYGGVYKCRHGCTKRQRRKRRHDSGADERSTPSTSTTTTCDKGAQGGTAKAKGGPTT